METILTREIRLRYWLLLICITFPLNGQLNITGYIPGANIKVINIADQKKAADLIKEGSIGFVSNEFYSGLKNESLWNEVVGRDVIVPVINAKNPFLDEISQHGISPAALSDISEK